MHSAEHKMEGNSAYPISMSQTGNLLLFRNRLIEEVQVKLSKLQVFYILQRYFSYCTLYGIVLCVWRGVACLNTIIKFLDI